MSKRIIAMMILMITMLQADITLTDEGCKMIFENISKYHDAHQEQFNNTKDNKFKKRFKEMKAFYNKHCIYRERLSLK